MSKVLWTFLLFIGLLSGMLAALLDFGYWPTALSFALSFFILIKLHDRISHREPESMQP